MGVEEGRGREKEGRDEGGQAKGDRQNVTKLKKKGYQKVTETEKKITKKRPKTKNGYGKVSEKESEWPTPFAYPGHVESCETCAMRNR